MKHRTGVYRGVRYSTVRLCDLFPHLSDRQLVLGTQWEDGGFDGNYFETVGDLRHYVDGWKDADDPQCECCGSADDDLLVVWPDETLPSRLLCCRCAAGDLVAEMIRQAE